MLDELLNFLSPAYCVNCSSLGSYFCDQCFAKITFLEKQLCPACGFVSTDGITHPHCLKPNSLNGHMSTTVYQGPVKKLIHSFKYGRYPVRNLSLVLDKILRLYFANEEDYFAPKTTVTPVPLHWWRQNARGYNQALILAQSLSKLWSLNLIPDLLQRTHFSLPQAKLSKKERLKNIQGLFRLNPKYHDLIKKETVILVDDVYTTGATLKQCARVLKKEGFIGSVYAVTLAYDEKRMIK